MTDLADGVMLGDAREWLRQRVDNGVHCPCCTQFAKVYRRKVTSWMARSLIGVYRASGQDWCHVATDVRWVMGQGGMWATLRFWNLIEEERALRSDGGRAGWWRVTPVGVAFLHGRITIPKYARLYDGRLLGLDGDQRISIHDALGSKFNYEELMAA